MANLDFTAHNIKLPDGSLTIPEMGWTIAGSPWLLSAQRVLEMTFPNGGKGKRIADLGCLEGGYTLEFAKMGMDAVGIEVRESNFKNAKYVKDAFNLDNLLFIRDDVWNIEKYGRFDAVFCCGILYHLNRPRAFIDILGRIVSDVIIINTHYASDQNMERFNLGPVEVNEGLPGRWYHEHNSTDLNELETFKWTSWGNQESFWLTKIGILHALHDTGFNLVFEQFDWLGNDILQSGSEGYYKENNRGQFVAIRTPR
jgi:SAM-dependent methyltransferase